MAAVTGRAKPYKIKPTDSEKIMRQYTLVELYTSSLCKASEGVDTVPPRQLQEYLGSKDGTPNSQLDSDKIQQEWNRSGG